MRGYPSDSTMRENYILHNIIYYYSDTNQIHKDVPNELPLDDLKVLITF